MIRYSEAQVSSDLLDQPEHAGPFKKIFICSTPRSGSYLLCRHMIHAGLGVPHEYFNPIVIRHMAPRLGFGTEAAGLNWFDWGRRDRLLLRRPERAAERAFLEKYLDILVRRRCQGGVFAAKMHFRDFTRVLDNPAGHKFLDAALFVTLFREDLLKQAVSEHFGQLTGRWGIDDTVTTTPSSHPDFLDAAAIDRALANLAEQDRGWRTFLARRGAVPMSISYEALCEDPFRFVCAISSRLGIDPATLRRGYTETVAPAAADPAIPSKADVASFYLSAARDRMAEDSLARERFDLRALIGR